MTKQQKRFARIILLHLHFRGGDYLWMGGREFHGIHNPDGLFLPDRFRRAGRAYLCRGHR